MCADLFVGLRRYTMIPVLLPLVDYSSGFYLGLAATLGTRPLIWHVQRGCPSTHVRCTI